MMKILIKYLELFHIARLSFQLEFKRNIKPDLSNIYASIKQLNNPIAVLF